MSPIDPSRETDTTEDDASSHSLGGPRRSPPLLTLVLESGSPGAGPLQVDAADLAELTIGRGRERKLVRDGPRALLMVPDRWMSTAHARVHFSARAFELEDAGSKNGTYVNNVPVDRVLLDDGDVIEIGHSFAVFRAPMPLAQDSGAEPPGAVELHTLQPAFASDLRRLRRIASSTVPVLLLGETGTGKEVAAREVHRASGRAGPYVAVNCPAIPASLLEAELFGSKKGAFSGAIEDRPGLVRSADRGTLFLDEIGDLPAAAQAALLRTLQESEVMPVGAARPLKVDVRVIAATHRDLDALVREGKFRADLLARLSGFRIKLPPLRERREDLGLLIAALLARHAGESAARLTFERNAARALMLHDWPLNVRELDKCLAAAVVLSAGGPISESHLHEAVIAALESRKSKAAAEELGDEDRVRRDQLLELMREHGGNIAAVARAQGKARMQIHR